MYVQGASLNILNYLFIQWHFSIFYYRNRSLKWPIYRSMNYSSPHTLIILYYYHLSCRIRLNSNYYFKFGLVYIYIYLLRRPLIRNNLRQHFMCFTQNLYIKKYIKYIIDDSRKRKDCDLEIKNNKIYIMLIMLSVNFRFLIYWWLQFILNW